MKRSQRMTRSKEKRLKMQRKRRGSNSLWRRGVSNRNEKEREYHLENFDAEQKQKISFISWTISSRWNWKPDWKATKCLKDITRAQEFRHFIRK